VCCLARHKIRQAENLIPPPRLSISLNFFILHPQPADVNQNSSEPHKACLSLGSDVIEPGGLACLEAPFINVTVDAYNWPGIVWHVLRTISITSAQMTLVAPQP
jgi:hypothetical protein